MPEKYNLIVVAHPDDETIFFSGLLLNRRTRPWKVVCVTDGNADGQALIRGRQFQQACRTLKVKEAVQWNFPDIYERRLDLAALAEKLESLPDPAEVYTHGIIGEYGHPHHQDVSFAVHKAFCRKRGSSNPPSVWSVAYNCFPDRKVNLTPAQFKTKTAILSEIYGSETQRFSHLLPATFTEGFTKVSLAEIEELYEFFTSGKSLNPGKLKSYRWWSKYLLDRGYKIPSRPF